MARGATARLPQRPQHGIARPVDINNRAQIFDALWVDKFSDHPLQRIGMRGAFIAAYLVLGLGQHHHTARTKHHIVIKILRHGFIQAAGFFINRGRGILQIIRADDCGVTPSIATTQPPFFKHCHIGDAKVLSQIISGGQTVAASPDDDHIIARLRRWCPPCTPPPSVIARGLAGNCKN